MSTTLIQVTNVSPSAGLQQMRELFSYFGDIEELRLFPEEEFAALSVPSKVCFINFKETDSAAACLHLSNTVLIDRALIIARSRHAEIPDGTAAMLLAAPAIALANNSSKPVGHTAPLLPTPPSLGAATPTGPASMAMGAANPAATILSPLISMMGTVVPQPPPLTGNVDPTKIEEIRRTIYVGNLASNMTAEQVLNFFQPCGEIKYVRMAGDETQPTRFAFVEFAVPESVPIALQYNGAMFGERPIKVNHSKNAIVKPQGPTAQETKRDVDEAMKRVKEAMMAIEASVVEPDVPVPTVKRPRSRSRSRDKRRRSRSRSRDRRRRSKSRSRDRYRRRSRSRSPVRARRRSRTPPRRRTRSRTPPRRRARSKTPPRRRSRSRTPPRRRSRSRSPRRRSRSRSVGRKRSRSRTPPRRSRHHRSRSRSRSPRRRRDRRSKSRSPRRHERKRDELAGRRDKSVSSSPEKPERSPPPKKSKSKKHRHRSHSRSPSPRNSSNERSSSRRKKHSKKHRRHHHKSRTPSPVEDVENGRDREDSGGSPKNGRSGSSEREESPVAVKAEEEPDTDSSYD